MKRLKDVTGLDFTIGDIHRGTGISRTMVSRIFSGQRSPSTESESKIAAYMGIRLDKFRDLWTKLSQSALSKSENVSPSSTEPSTSPVRSKPNRKATLQ